MISGAHERLLDETREIVCRHEVLARTNGLKFNLFEILGLATNEVYGHSAFLGELLSPTGCHGQGDIFLRAFFDVLFQTIPNFEMPSKQAGQWRLYVERNFASIDRHSDSRIDLILENSDFWIIIENKINAEDQPRQIQRYVECAKRLNKQHRLFYLTLDGHNPSPLSLGNVPLTAVGSISYRTTIEPWLAKCAELADSIPPIRESIHQYIRLVRRLTGVDVLKELEMELRNLLLNSAENFNAAQEISKAIIKAKETVLLQFWEEVRAALIERGEHPQNIISDFQPSPARVAEFCNGTRKSGIGYSIPVFDPSLSSKVVMNVAVYTNVYFGFAVVKGDKWSRETTSSSERATIRNACARAGYDCKEQDSVWFLPSRRISFDSSGYDRRLVDSQFRKEAAAEIAAEAVAALKRVRAELSANAFTDAALEG